MDTPNIRAIDTDRFRGDVIVTFSDNRAAVFSAAFLYAFLSQAQEIFESELALNDEYTRVQ